MYGPYVRVVRTGHPYIRPVYTAPYIRPVYTARTKKHCSQCFSAVRPVYTGRRAKTATNNNILDTNILCGTVGDVTQRHSIIITRNGKYLPSFLFCRKNTTYIASTLFRSRIDEMSVIEDDAAYFPRCSDTVLRRQ